MPGLSLKLASGESGAGPADSAGPLRPDCDTVVAALVLCGAVSADSPKFGCDSGDCFYETSYDVDSSDYSGYDGYDKLDLNSSPDVWGGIDPSYVASDIDFLHELHGPISVGSFVSCMDVLHQRTVNFPMP